MQLSRFEFDFNVSTLLHQGKQSGRSFPPIPCLKLVQVAKDCNLRQAYEYCLMIQRTCRTLDHSSMIRQVQRHQFYLETNLGQDLITGQFLEKCSPERAEKIKATIRNWGH